MTTMSTNIEQQILNSKPSTPISTNKAFADFVDAPLYTDYSQHLPSLSDENVKHLIAQGYKTPFDLYALFFKCHTSKSEFETKMVDLLGDKGHASDLAEAFERKFMPVLKHVVP